MNAEKPKPVCGTCLFWDDDRVRFRGKPESICNRWDSPDHGRYVNAYHTCPVHSVLRPPRARHYQPPTGEDHA